MDKPKIVILMSTYNGEKYLDEQIKSLLSQKNVEIDILVRDDSSTDSTVDILRKYEHLDCFSWYTGENLKPAKSFMDLVYKVKEEYDYYCFCDQDDVWLEDRCEIAAKRMSKFSSSIPCVSYCKPIIVDTYLNKIESSYCVRKEKHVNNYKTVLICSAEMPGCTMMMNDALIKILHKYSPKHVTMHDSWVQKVCIACGGKFVYADGACMLYRQHENNSIGVNKGRKKLLEAIFGKEIKRSAMLNEIYMAYKEYMPEKTKTFMSLIYNYKKSWSNTYKLAVSVTNDFGWKRKLAYILAIIMRRF